MVKELLAEGFTEEQIVDAYVRAGVAESKARQIVAIELGDDDADDLIEVPRDA